MMRRLAGVVAAAGFAVLGNLAADAAETHGVSTFGELKYAADFPHFDYVNPDAPKGGTLSMIGTSSVITFDSLNAFILKGDPAQGLTYLFDTLMVRAYDEPDAVYGLVARSAEMDEDGQGITFRLRPEARFADGSQVTAEDVAFSFEIIKEKGHPSLALPLRDVASAEAIDKLTVHYTFQGEQTRDLPRLVAVLPILSKAYYTTNDFAETSLKPPLGSGPYRVGKFRQGRFINYERRDDYWAKDLPVNVGRYNFDTLRYEYFRDRTAGFEGFKSGEFDLREEFTSKTWATEYDIPPVRDGRIVRDVLPDGSPSGAQGFFLNTRRDKFADIRVREALGLAFDFEWTNKNLFYGLYKRTHSYFENSEMKATGSPEGEELALLEPYRDDLPPSVFADAQTPPVTDGSGQDRKLLRQASRLLKEAGWTVQDGKRKNAAGEVLEIEFLIFAPTFERVIAPYVNNLKRLGIDARIRLVDAAQFQRRLESFDYDVLVQRFVLSVTPGVELRTYLGSASADVPGSLNLAGIKNPAVDALIEKVIGAKSRDELVTAARALDRVLRAGHYWVPHWYKASHMIAYWNKFSRPEKKPAYNRGVIETWWYDEAKAAKLLSQQ